MGFDLQDLRSGAFGFYLGIWSLVRGGISIERAGWRVIFFCFEFVAGRWFCDALFL